MIQTTGQILAGDARLVLPDSFVADVMVADPPYRAHVHDKARSQDQHIDGGVRHNDFGFASLTEEFRTWICKLAARTKRWSIIYTDVESVAVWKEGLEAQGATYIRTLPWVRWSMPCLAGDRPPQGFECLVVAYGFGKGRKHWNGAGNLTHLAHEIEDWKNIEELLSRAADGDLSMLTHINNLALRGKEKFKTEKPLDQLLDLVSWFSDPNETVIDPCSGSGTTGLACKILGRNFIGCELDAEWAEKGNARIRSCDPSVLPGSLSARDNERFLRWVNTTEQEKGDAAKRKANTERVRARLADKKLALTPAAQQKEKTMIPQTWTEAYEQCLTRPLHGGGRADGAGAPEPAVPSVAMARSPLTSAAERTVPLFGAEDEYTAKKWRDAYGQAVSELAPSLSPALLAKIAEKRAGAPLVASQVSATTIVASQASDAVVVSPASQASDAVYFCAIDAYPGEPPLSLLVNALREQGRHVSLVDISGWSAVRRDVARAWAAQGGDCPDWMESATTEVKSGNPNVVRPGVACQSCGGSGYNTSKTARCSDCDGCGQANAARWQTNEGAGFYDPTKLCPVCQGAGCGTDGEDCSACAGSGHPLLPDRMVETPVPATAPTPSIETPVPAKRGKGRPPGVKNKAPKLWKEAMARVAVELGTS